jgi:hypothetical protein
MGIEIHKQINDLRNQHNGIFIHLFSLTAAQCGLWLPRFTRFRDQHNDAPQSVGILWTSD